MTNTAALLLGLLEMEIYAKLSKTKRATFTPHPGFSSFEWVK